MTTTVTGLLCWRDFHPLEWQLASLHWSGRAPALPAREAGQGHPRHGARYVLETHLSDRRDPHRYRQELVSHHRPRSARCHRAAAEVVTRPGGNALANLPPCLIGMEACVGAHHLSRKLQMLGHDACVPIRRDRRMTSVMRKPSRGGAAANDHPRLRRRIFTWASLHLRWAFQMLEPFVRYSSPCSPQALQGSASSTSRRACHCLGHQAVPG